MINNPFIVGTWTWYSWYPSVSGVTAVPPDVQVRSSNKDY
jgi:hypothetical protein